jgi:hypothetical protein
MPQKTMTRTPLFIGHTGPSGTSVGAKTAGSDWYPPGSLMSGAAFDQVFIYQTISTTTLPGQYADCIAANNFGFSGNDITSGSTIDGIEFIIWKKALTTRTRDILVHMLRGNRMSGSNMANTVSEWNANSGSTSFGTSASTYGWSGAKWGLPWTIDDIYDTNFGLMLQMGGFGTAGNRTGMIDSIECTIYFTEPSTGSVTPTYFVRNETTHRQAIRGAGD